MSRIDWRSDQAVVAEVARQRAVLGRGVVQVLSERDFEEKLGRSIKAGVPLRVKLGVDPTSTFLHLGFTVVLNKLRAFQDCGHQAVLIIGDATAMVGDPTGRNKTRPRLTREEVEANAATYLEQVVKILDLGKAEIRRNSEWLGKLDFLGMVELASKTTVARMLEREDFAARYEAGTPIFLHEFIYPLLQGRDSVEIRSDVELGGTDQTFNLLVGRDLQLDAGQEAQVCMTTPILPGLDGVQKMSKSFGNFIGIAEPADEMFGKAMSIPDALVRDYFTLTTSVPLAEIDRLLAGHPRDAKVALGKALVERYHDASAAEAAALRFRRVFSEKQVPDEIPEVTVPGSLEKPGEGFWIVDVIMAAGFAKSRGDARRVTEQGGVTIDGTRVESATSYVDLRGGEVLKVGKLQFARLRRDRTT